MVKKCPFPKCHQKLCLCHQGFLVACGFSAELQRDSLHPPGRTHLRTFVSKHIYSPARKYEIHKCRFSEIISRKSASQLHKNTSLELIYRKITLHVFVCDSENYMEKMFANDFLRKSHFSTCKKVFGINFAAICDWSVFVVQTKTFRVLFLRTNLQVRIEESRKSTREAPCQSVRGPDAGGLSGTHSPLSVSLSLSISISVSVSLSLSLYPAFFFFLSLSLSPSLPSTRYLPLPLSVSSYIYIYHKPLLCCLKHRNPCTRALCWVRVLERSLEFIKLTPLASTPCLIVMEHFTRSLVKQKYTWD